MLQVKLARFAGLAPPSLLARAGVLKEGSTYNLPFTTGRCPEWWS